MSHIIYVEAYIPNTIDAHNETMDADTVREMAHRFLSEGRVKEIDVNHNGRVVAGAVVESFIARPNDPEFIPGSWVVGIAIEDDLLWDAIASGQLNGISIDGTGFYGDEVEIELPDVITGETTSEHDHVHTFVIRISEQGAISGSTNEANGHSHLIRSGTVTESAHGHSHKYSFVDLLPTLRVSTNAHH